MFSKHIAPLGLVSARVDIDHQEVWRSRRPMGLFRMKGALAASAMLTAFLVPHSASASLSAPTVFVHARENDGSYDDRHGTAFGNSAPVVAQLSNKLSQGENIFASATVLPGAVAATSITGGTSAGVNLSAFASVQYDFEILGPSNISTLVNFRGAANATNAGALGDTVFSESFLYLSGTLLGGSCVDSGAFVGECAFYGLSQSDNINRTIRLNTNTVYNLQLISQSGYGRGNQHGNIIGSYVDPYISLDSAFLLANPGYSVDVSPGVGNAPAAGVPEPTTWTVMIAGFFGLGIALRGRRLTPARAQILTRSTSSSEISSLRRS